MGGDVVQKRAVVADQKQRAVVVGEQFFEQFQRFGIQVVGWLVEHQNVGGTGEQAGEQQTVALAAGKRAYRRTRTRGREEKIAQITDDVFAHAANFDKLGAGADDFGERALRFKLGAHLVEIRHLLARATANLAAVGFQFAKK